MIRSVIIFFLLLAGLCYLSSVLEFDEEESKANFKQEQQLKVVVLKTVNFHQSAQIIVFFITPLGEVYEDFSSTSLDYQTLHNLSTFIPPERLFLKNSVFRI